MSVPIHTIIEVVRHIRDNMTNILDVNSLAMMAGVGAIQFTKAFRRATGMTPTRFLSEVRVEESKLLMAEPDARLADVAMACGFHSQPHFNRAFKTVTGITPGDYRRGVPSKQCMLCPRGARCGSD